MRIKTFVLCAFSAITVVVSAQEKYTIKGTAGKDMNGKQLYLYQLEDGETVKDVLLDSAEVKKGKFSFSGVQEKPRIAVIKQEKGDKVYPVILEKGKIRVDMVADCRRGTALNDTLDMAIHEMQPFMDKMKKWGEEFKNLMESVKREERVDKMLNDTVFKKKFEEISKRGMIVRDSLLFHLNPHKNSLAGVYLFAYNGGAMLYKDIESVKEGASPVFLDHILVKKSIELKKQYMQRVEERIEKNMSKEEREARKKEREMEAKIKIGQRFPDAKVKDMAGKEVALSDYIGKGKYVLIDFWASWCGPCRREMPHVKAAYEKYASKGFEVVSISTDAKEQDWKNAVQALGMTWTQLQNVDAADIYGVYFIPSTFLVDKDGIIIQKKLRGKGLEEALSKLIE